MPLILQHRRMAIRANELLDSAATLAAYPTESDWLLVKRLLLAINDGLQADRHSIAPDTTSPRH